MLLFVGIVTAFSQDLIQIQSFWRHGARTPVFCNWNCEYFKENNLLGGQLTSTGMRQHYVLGDWFRQQYTGNGKLLSQTFDEEEIQIYTTDVQRTILSALANLQGMYPEGTGLNIFDDVDLNFLKPPNQFDLLPDIPQGGALPYRLQVVPIRMVEFLNDWIFEGLFCAKATIWQQFNKNSLLTQKVQNYSKELIQNFALQMDLDPSNVQIQFIQISIFNLADYQDTFISSMFNGYRLPQLTDDVMEGLDNLYSLVISLQLYQTWEQVRLMSQPLFRNLIANMDNKIQGYSKYKYLVFSAHDSTVQLMAMALNLTSAECMAQVYMKEPVDNENCIYTYPGYASNMIFELYKDGIQTYWVKLRYNGTYLNLCNSKQISCEYQQFKRLLEAQMTNYEEECLIKEESDIKQSNIPLWMLITCPIMVIILIVSCIFSFKLFKQLKLSKIDQLDLQVSIVEAKN